jgi:hypothetical protein
MVQSGDSAEIIIAGELMELDFPVSKPLSDNEPYDLIADVNGDLVKVQVKRMHKVSDRVNSIRALLTKHGGDMSQSRRTYKSDEVDAFAFYHNGNIYWAWFDETPDTTMTLSLKDEEEVEARHLPKTRFAKNYKLTERLK